MRALLRHLDWQAVFVGFVGGYAVPVMLACVMAPGAWLLWFWIAAPAIAGYLAARLAPKLPLMHGLVASICPASGVGLLVAPFELQAHGRARKAPVIPTSQRARDFQSSPRMMNMRTCFARNCHRFSLSGLSSIACAFATRAHTCGGGSLRRSRDVRRVGSTVPIPGAR